MSAVRWLVALPAAATALAAIRWATQGSQNLYSTMAHRYYVPDPDLGWRLVEDGPVWLGLDVVAGLSLATVALWGLGHRLTAHVTESQSSWVRVLGAAGALTLLVPLIAWWSGMPPDSARARRPAIEAAPVGSGIEASLPGFAQATYRVAEPASSVTATVSAGGEQFETRFGGLTGELRGNPSALADSLSARFSIDATTADTGVDTRSKHAQEYLQTESFPTIELRALELAGVQAQAEGSVAFAATAELSFIGDRIPVELRGTVSSLDAAARERLGLTAPQALAVVAEFSLALADTKLSADASDFSADSIPLRIELVLIPSST